MNEICEGSTKNRITRAYATCDGGPGSNFLRGEVIQGQATIVARTTIAQYRRTSWLAPQLACEELQSTVDKFQPDGSFTAWTESRVVKLILGEPDTTFFDRREQAMEVRPSDAGNLMRRDLGLSFSAEEKSRLEEGERKADRRYNGQNWKQTSTQPQ